MYSPLVATTNQRHTAHSRQRIHVRVYRGSSWRFVDVEPTASGDLAFWDEEPGDVRRYPFAPSPAERQALLDALQTNAECGRVSRYIDLDVPLEALAAAADVSLAAFRRFVHDTGQISEAVDLDRRILAFLQATQRPDVIPTTAPTPIKQDSDAHHKPQDQYERRKIA